MGCLTGGSCFRVPELWTLLPSFCIGEALGVGGWVGRWVGWGGGSRGYSEQRSTLAPPTTADLRGTGPTTAEREEKEGDR